MSADTRACASRGDETQRRGSFTAFGRCGGVRCSAASPAASSVRFFRPSYVNAFDTLVFTIARVPAM